MLRPIGLKSIPKNQNWLGGAVIEKSMVQSLPFYKDPLLTYLLVSVPSILTLGYLEIQKCEITEFHLLL